MTNIMHTNLFHSCLLRPSLHLMVEIGFRDRKQPLVWLNVVKHFDIFPYFLTEKWRHFDCTVTLFCFRTCDNIPPFRSVKRLADCDCLLLKIKISRSECQQFCFCQYKSKKNLLLIRKKHHCFHPVMLLRTILFRLCFFFFVENVIHLPAYLHTTWFINKDFLNNL